MQYRTQINDEELFSLNASAIVIRNLCVYMPNPSCIRKIILLWLTIYSIEIQIISQTGAD